MTLPLEYKPMLCASPKGDIDTLLKDKNYVFQRKFDGVRCIAIKHNSNVQLYSRDSKSLTKQFPEIASALAAINSPSGTNHMVLDGEICAISGGFQALQQRLGVIDITAIKALTTRIPCEYIIFDVLGFGIGENQLQDPKTGNLLSHPFIAPTGVWSRSHVLQAFTQLRNAPLTTSLIIEDGQKAMEYARNLKWEGIVAKRKDAWYYAGVRHPNAWIKIKPVETTECLVIGYTDGTGKRRGKIGALVLADIILDQVQHSVKIKYVGKVGTGFTDADLDEWTKLMKPLCTIGAVRVPPLATDDMFHVDLRVAEYWLRQHGEIPKDLPVVEIEYQEKTADGIFRFPSYKRVRTDKNINDFGECRKCGCLHGVNSPCIV